jgi:hypothetical protein
MPNLYLDGLPELETELRKEAAFGARLGETPENWPQELTSELYKQLPFLSDYEVNVNLDRVDQQRRFAFGYADVSNKTERPEAEHLETGMPHVRVPIVVLEGAAKPFSVFLDNESVLPMSEERIRETLFNPATFDISASQPRDPSLVEQLMPPTRSGAGQGGEYKMASADPAMVKTATGPRTIQRASDLAGKLMQTAKGRVRVREVANRMAHTAVRMEGKAERALRHPAALSPKNINNRLHHKVLAGQHSAAHSAVRHGAFDEIDRAAVPVMPKFLKEKNASLLHAIAPTLREQDVERVLAKIASSEAIKAGLRRAGVVDDLVEVLDNTKRASASDRLAYIAEQIEPSVITLHKFPGGDFLMKHANVDALNPQAMQGQVVPGQEAAGMIGQENAQAMTPGQTATIVPNPIELDEPYEAKAKVIEEFGEYKVQDTMGNTLMGWVFPTTLAWDGAFSAQPMAVFSNGAAYALQDSIAGELVGKSTNLPVEQQPVGEGVFYTSQGGNAVCTQPVTVRSAMAGPDGQPKIMCHDAFGQQLVVSFMDGLASPQRITDMEYAFPRSWKFMRLNNQTQLVGGGQPDMGAPQDAGAEGGMSDAGGPPAPKKPAAKKPSEKKESKPEKKEEGGGTKVEVNVDKAKKEKTSAVLFYNGGYNIQGGCGLHKLAAELRYDMSPVDAEFMLGLLGVDGLVAKQKVAEARRKGSVKLAGLRTITTLAERYQAITKTASALARKVPDLRKDLVKEASVLQDRSTVNDILALNFINPENLSTFVSYVPELEETSERLAEMLLYSYLGMNDLPEGAITRSMNAVEEVLTNLKNLSETGGESTEEE